MPGARVGEGQVQSWACALCDLDREGSLTGVAPACPRPRKAARSWPGRQGEGRAFWAEEPCAQNSGTDAGCLSEPALEWPQLCTGPTECWGLRPGHWCSLREAPPGTALPGLQLQQEVTEGGADPGGSSAGGTSAFWYNVKVDPVGVAVGLDAEGEGKRGVKDDSRIWA